MLEGHEEYLAMLSNVTASVTSCLNHRSCSILTDDVLKATCNFKHRRWPSVTNQKSLLEAHGDSRVELLREHYQTLFSYMGGDANKVQREWRRLKLFVSRDLVLFNLHYGELYKRLFDQNADKFLYDEQRKVTNKLNGQSSYNVLLLAAIV